MKRVDSLEHIITHLFKLAVIVFYGSIIPVIVVALFSSVFFGFNLIITTILLAAVGFFVANTLAYIMYPKRQRVAYVITAFLPMYIGFFLSLALQAPEILFAGVVGSGLVSIIFMDKVLSAIVFMLGFGLLLLQIFVLNIFFVVELAGFVVLMQFLVVVISLLVILFLTRYLKQALAESYMSHRQLEQTLSQQHDQQQSLSHQLEERIRYQEGLLAVLDELESGLIPLANGTVVLPMIGFFDTERLIRLETRVLYAVREFGTETLLIDVTALQVTEFKSFKALRRFIDTLRLLGVEVALTGMNPQMARLLAKHQITRRDVRSFMQLQDALAYLASA